MSKTQKQAAISPFIYLPLGGAAIGGLADYAIGRKTRQKAEVDSNGKKIKTPEGETDSKENARRLLRSLILGGGVGLGLATLINGGQRIIDATYGVKTGSAKKSKLLAKLVKQAAEENNFFADPKSNYLIGGGASLLGGLALYHFLNDKKKRSLGGYLGAGLTGLGAGLAGAGLYNKSFHGNWLGVPEANKPKPEDNKTETTSLESNTSATVESTPDTNSNPVTNYFNSPEGKEFTSFITALNTNTSGNENTSNNANKEEESSKPGGGRWLFPVGWGVPGVASILAGFREGYKRQSPGKGTPQELAKRTERQNARAKSWDVYNNTKWNHPLLKSIMNVVTLGERPSMIYGNRLGNWLGEKVYNRRNGSDRLSGTAQQAYSADTGEGFKSIGKFTRSELPLIAEEPVNWKSMTPAEQEAYRKSNQFTETAGGNKLSAENRRELYNAYRNAVRMNVIAKATANTEAERLAETLKNNADALFAKHGLTFGELPETVRNSLLTELLKGTGLSENSLDNYTYKGNKLLKDLIKFEQARESDPKWSVNNGILEQAEAVKDSLPQDILASVNKGRYALEAGELKSPIDGMANRYADAVQKAYTAYINEPTNDAKYNALEKSVNEYKDALKSPRTFGEAGFNGPVSEWKYTTNPEIQKAIVENAKNGVDLNFSSLKPEAFDALYRLQDFAPQNLQNQIKELNSVYSILNRSSLGKAPEKSFRKALSPDMYSAIAEYQGATTPEQRKAAYDKISNIYATEEAIRNPVESVDITTNFRNSVKSGKYPDARKLIENIDALQGQISALERVSEGASNSRLERLKAEYNAKLNFLAKQEPSAVNTPKAQLLRGGRLAANVGKQIVSGMDYINSNSEKGFESLSNSLDQLNDWIKRRFKPVEEAGGAVGSKGTPENAPEPSTGNSAVDEKLNEINERRNATEGGDVKPNAEPVEDDFDRMMRESYEQENSPEYKAKQEAETKARIQQQKELDEFLKDADELLTEEERRQIRERSGKPGFYEWSRNLQKTVRSRVPATMWGRVREFFKKLPKRIKEIK